VTKRVLAGTDGSPEAHVAVRWAARLCARQVGLAIRANVHTGEIEQRGERHRGDRRPLRRTDPSRRDPALVLVLGTVPPLVTGGGISFHDLGERVSKGAPRAVAATRGRLTPPRPTTRHARRTTEVPSPPKQRNTDGTASGVSSWTARRVGAERSVRCGRRSWRG
jgi:hypothetical protein